MLLVHSPVGCSKLLLKAESKLNLDFFLINSDWGYHLILKTVMNMLQLLWKTLRKKAFRTSNWNLFCFDLCLVLLPRISAETLAQSLQLPLLSYQIALLFSKPFLWAKQSQLLQLFFRGKVLPFAEPAPVTNVILVLVLKLAAFSQMWSKKHWVKRISELTQSACSASVATVHCVCWLPCYQGTLLVCLSVSSFPAELLPAN